MVNGAAPTSPVSLNLFDVFTGTLADGSVFIVPQVRFRSRVFRRRSSEPAIAAARPYAQNNLDSKHAPRLAGQSLTLNTGGQLPTYFNAVGAAMKVAGGTIGRGMKAVNSNFTLTSGTIRFEPSLYSNSTFTMTGGTVGESLALINSTAYISGGTVDQYLRPIYSTVTINGGTIGNNLSVVSSTVNFRGGTTGLRTSVHSGSVFNWSGGAPGVDFSATPGGTINIYGTQFNYGPTDLNSLLTLNTPYPLTLRSTILHGMLANGQSFGFDTRQSPATAMINLILVIPGDFNFDGAVDSADYVTWRKALAPRTRPPTTTPGVLTSAKRRQVVRLFPRRSPSPPPRCLR